MTTVAGAGARRRPFVLELPAVACTVVLLAVAFCVVYPLLLVVLESFQVAPPGQPAKCGLDGWRAAFAEPLLRAALINTLKVTVTRQALSLALAILVAWLIARTDLPGRNWIEFAFWAAFFLPTLTVTLSWILLLDPDYGLIVTRVPRYDAATALSVVVLAAMLPLIVTQQWLTRGRRYTTITGQFQSRRHRLGRWRWPAFVLALSLTLVVLGVPLVFAVLGTFMKLFGFFNIPDPWTLKNWKTVLTDDLFLRSLVNTVVLATSTAFAAVLIHSMIAYIVVRTRYRARQALDVISWLPFTVPGIILGLALLWLFLDVGFLRPMYGTMAVLVTAGLVSGMPLGVQIVKS